MKKINARPTKSFFVNTITKDVSLIDSILDLIDNSIDGYIKRKYSERKEILINFDNDIFEILDNCGGIEKDKVYDNIFRFGNNYVENNRTIGVFGVGLKRSIFKIGKDITIESDDGINYFSIKIDKKWLDDEDNWDLEFEKENNTTGNIMTKISIKEINNEYINMFTNKFFENSLIEKIKDVYSYYLEHSVNIKVNGTKVEHFHFAFISDDVFKPFHKKGKINKVEYEIFAGFQNEDNKEQIENKYGWYVFCNDRMILKNDVSLKTGWSYGERKYHYPEDNRFLGLLFMRSDNPLELPWNTTKEDIQPENVTYKSLKTELEAVTKDFTNFIRSTGEFKDPETNETIGKSIFQKRNSIPIRKITEESEGLFPNFNQLGLDKIQKLLPTITNISYSKDKNIVKKLKDILGDPYMSNKALGEKTFDYFVDIKEVK